MSKLNAKEIIELSKKHTLFSWANQKSVDPIAVDHAKGVYFWDVDGKRYLDLASQLMLSNIGHGDPRVNRAIYEQANKINYVYTGQVTEVRARLGELLAQITPSKITKSLFTLGGADAIDNAMKIARLYSGKQKIVARYRAYHGASFGSMSAGGDPRKIPNEPGVPWVVHVHDPYAYRSPLYRHCSAEEGEDILADLILETVQLEGPGTVAGILLEGYSGGSGIIQPTTKNFWHKIRKICDEYNIALIVDEVMSGFGRTGKWFGIDHYDICPDIMAMAKGLTSGYVPMGAVAVTEKIAEHFDNNFLACGMTYNSHPLACAAALANINVLQEDKLIERAADMGLRLERKLMALKSRHPCVGDVRGKGLHFCLELVKNQETKIPISEWNAPPSKPMVEMARYFREQGLSTILRWNFVFVCPPLCITESELDEGLSIVAKGLEIADKYTN